MSSSSLFIEVPVECQNGHKAKWVWEIRGLEPICHGVPNENKCDCPKCGFGQGYHAVGTPKVVENQRCD